MKRTEAIGIRVTNDVKAAAIDAALDDNRSVSSLLEKLLVDYLVSQGYVKTTQTRPRRQYPRLATTAAEGGIQLPLRADSD